MFAKLWPKPNQDGVEHVFTPRAPDSETLSDDQWGLEDLPDGRVRMRLRFPVAVGPEQIKGLAATTTVSEIVLRRPRGADMRALPSDAAASPYASLAFFGRLIDGHPPELIDHLDMVDVTRITGVVSRFLSPGRPTGG